ncbi:MAG: hypothetical protein ACYTF1_05280 [Planctomycetota bacterium]|jgi:hypothetical protein
MKVMGLYLSESDLVRAELQRSGRLVKIIRLDRKPLQPQQEDASQDVYKHDGDIPVKQIASLPGRDVMTRYWSFPDTDVTRFGQMVAHRLEATLPLPVEQLTWGYRRGRRISSENGNVSVLAQAAKRERITQYMSSLSAAGVGIDILTTEAEGLEALYQHGLGRADVNGPEVLVLAAAKQWLVALFVEGMIRSVRHIGTDTDGMERACQECRHFIEYEIPIDQLDNVLWCASPDLDRTCDHLSKCLGVVVEHTEPMEHFLHADGRRIESGKLAEYATAIGLALAGMFEPDQIIRLAGQEEVTVETRWPQWLERLIARPGLCGVAAVSLLVLATVIHLGSVGWEKHKMNKLVDTLNQSESGQAELFPKIQAKQRLEKYRVDVEGIIADLCKAIPESMVITSIQLSRDQRMVIKGTAGDPKTIFALADALRKGDRFATVNPERTDLAKGGGFTITTELVGIEQSTSSSQRGGRWH